MRECTLCKGGGERKSIYIAPFCTKVHTNRSGMDHTVLSACLSFVSVHQMSPPQQLRQQTSNCSSLLIYRPRKDEGLSWPSWLTYSGWFTHISGHPSATSRVQDSESTSAKDQCSTAGPRHQHYVESLVYVQSAVYVESAVYVVVWCT